MAGWTELFAVINGVSVTQGQRAIVREAEESHLCQIFFLPSSSCHIEFYTVRGHTAMPLRIGFISVSCNT